MCLCVHSGAFVRVRACMHTCGRVCAFVRAYMSVEMRARVMRVHVINRSPTSTNSPGDVKLFLVAVLSFRFSARDCELPEFARTV